MCVWCVMQLQVSSLLVHYDLKKPLQLACDPSPCGVGALISHTMENGEGRAITFASGTVTASEYNYHQLEKGAQWSLILAAYQYGTEYWKAGEHANADALSRLVLLTSEDESETQVFMISYVDELPITAGDVASATQKDPVLARVYDFTLHGWPQSVKDSLMQKYLSH